MEEESKSGPVLLDKDNGFPRIYHSVRSDIAYSMVIVPPDADFHVTYQKPSCGIDIVCGVNDANMWTVSGVIDSDIYSNFGLAVAQWRSGGTPPVITDENLEQAKEFGQVAQFGTSLQDLPLFTVHLTIPPHMMLTFLRRVWHPHVSLARNPWYVQQRIPLIHVGNTPDRDRVLPQKKPLHAVSKIATLTVLNHRIASKEN